MCYMTYFITAMHFMTMSEATKINFLGLENLCIIASTLPLHADCFDVLHALLHHCYALHGHGHGHQDQLLRLENFSMLNIASTLSLHADCFDVLHDLIHHCYALHGHVRGHQDQLLEVGDFFHVIHYINFASYY